MVEGWLDVQQTVFWKVKLFLGGVIGGEKLEEFRSKLLEIKLSFSRVRKKCESWGQVFKPRDQAAGRMFMSSIANVWFEYWL